MSETEYGHTVRLETRHGRWSAVYIDDVLVTHVYEVFLHATGDSRPEVTLRIRPKRIDFVDVDVVEAPRIPT